MGIHYSVACGACNAGTFPARHTWRQQALFGASYVKNGAGIGRIRSPSGTLRYYVNLLGFFFKTDKRTFGELWHYLNAELIPLNKKAILFV